jgi:hypothetical protein
VPRELATELKGHEFVKSGRQQYLVKVPNGYRCHSATRVPFPTGV